MFNVYLKNGWVLPSESFPILCQVVPVLTWDCFQRCGMEKVHSNSFLFGIRGTSVSVRKRKNAESWAILKRDKLGIHSQLNWKQIPINVQTFMHKRFDEPVPHSYSCDFLCARSSGLADEVGRYLSLKTDLSQHKSSLIPTKPQTANLARLILFHIFLSDTWLSILNHVIPRFCVQDEL